MSAPIWTVRCDVCGTTLSLVAINPTTLAVGHRCGGEDRPAAVVRPESATSESATDTQPAAAAKPVAYDPEAAYVALRRQYGKQGGPEELCACGHPAHMHVGASGFGVMCKPIVNGERGACPCRYFSSAGGKQ